MCMSWGSHQGSAVPTSCNIYNSNLMISVFWFRVYSLSATNTNDSCLNQTAQWMCDSISNSIQLQNNDALMAKWELRTSARWNHTLFYLYIYFSTILEPDSSQYVLTWDDKQNSDCNKSDEYDLSSIGTERIHKCVQLMNISDCFSG